MKRQEKFFYKKNLSGNKKLGGIMDAKFNISKGRQTGEVVKKNTKTVWVRFNYKKNIAEEGADAIFKTFTATIKRHFKKHNVELLEST